MENVHFYFPLLDYFYIDIYKYHTFLHHSQTQWRIWSQFYVFEYHTFLHHSQTLEAANETYKSLNTIHFYIILKRKSRLLNNL